VISCDSDATLFDALRPPARLRDPERLAVLRATGLLEEERVELFDRLARAAAHALHAPVAQVNLVAEDRQIPSASYGAEGGAVVLDDSLCQHVAASGEALVLGDTRAGESAATRENEVAAYAAVPLTTAAGHTLGALCVMDFAARDWTDAEVEILRDLAGVAVADIENRLRSDLRAHDALRESEARYRTLTEVDPDGIVVMDDTGIIVSANPAMERIFGYPLEELVGEPLTVLVPQRFREAHNKGMQRYLATGRRNIPWTGIELPGLTRSGREVAIELAFGEYVHEGRHVFAGFIHDISRRKREEARRLTEHAVTRVLAGAAAVEEAAPGILRTMGEMLRWDLGVLWRVEAGTLRFVTGWHAPGVDGEPFEAANRDAALGVGEGLPGRVWERGEAVWIQELSGDPNFPRARIAAEAGLRTGFAFPITGGGQTLGVIEFFARDAEIPDESMLRTMEAMGSEIGQFIVRKEAEAERDRALADAVEARAIAEEQAGELERQTGELQNQAAQLQETQAELEIAVFELQRTNGELRQRTEEAEQATTEAEEANRAKSQFLANMSHELRTPINAIMGYTDLLEMGIAGALNEQQRAHLERVRSSSQHLLSLVNEILDLAKVESGQLRVARERSALREALDAALGLVVPQAVRAGVAVRDEVAPDADTAYWGDPERVQQILANLLTNAIKFTRRGGSVRVGCAVTDQPDSTVQARGSGNWLRVDVEDTGVGIAPEHQEEIFQPFFQVDGGYTRESGGTGLGLSISRRLARLMGGDVTLQSRPGNGSCFTLWLPTDSEQAAAEERQRAGQAAPHPVPRLAEVGRLLVRCAEAIVAEWGGRLRAEPSSPRPTTWTAPSSRTTWPRRWWRAGLSLLALGEGGGELALLRDGTDIQRVVFDRHGRQRSRLGWSRAALHREYQLLRELVDATLRGSLPPHEEGHGGRNHGRPAPAPGAGGADQPGRLAESRAPRPQRHQGEPRAGEGERPVCRAQIR
jgi:PAS domain S-box-containing protein